MSRVNALAARERTSDGGPAKAAAGASDRPSPGAHWHRLASNAGILQPKLTVNAPGDRFEEEADRVADQVLRMPEPAAGAVSAPPAVQRKCAACEEEETFGALERALPKKYEDDKLQAKESPGAVPRVAPRTEARIAALRNAGGAPLSPAQRGYFEPRFGRDLSGVRLHADAHAQEAAREVRARAFTVGQDIAFAAGELRPESAEGRRLLAHELAHTVQQGGRSRPQTRLARKPGAPRGTEAVHADLIEQFRSENGLPPHGVDEQGQPVGPSDSEIRFGGLLEAWLRGGSAPQTGPTGRPAPQPAPAPQPTPAPTPAPAPAPAPQTAPAPTSTPTVRSVPAPATAPTLVGRGTTSVVAMCQNAPDVGACRQHQSYVRNVLPQAIANIRAVPTPYSRAIADLFAAALPAAQAAPAPTPANPSARQFGRSVNAPAGAITVTVGSAPHAFTNFTLTLQQWPNGANGQAFGIGGSVAFVQLNELSRDALLGNLAGIEETIVHETTHIFMSIAEARNSARAAGAPLADPNLDRGSYAAVQARLEAALLPFVTQIHQLPSLTGLPPLSTTAQDARSTARTFLSETIARVEAAIFVRQRAGQGFTRADLANVGPFHRADSYWSPTPPVLSELTAYLATNQAAIDAAIRPLVLEAGEVYLNLRP